MREQMREAFDAVRTSEAYRQRMAQSVQERLAKRTRRHATGMLRYALAAACCFLVLVLGSYGVYAAPVTTVSLDINPSLTLQLNRFDRVVGVLCHNAQAQTVIQQLRVKNLTCEDAVTSILQSDAMHVYLKEDAQVYFCVAASSDQVARRVQTKLELCAGNCHVQSSNDTATQKDVDEAAQAGMSVGRYCIYRRLVSSGVDVTQQDAASWSMKRLRACEKEGTDAGRGQQNGNASTHGDGARQSQDDTDDTVSPRNEEHGGGHGHGSGNGFGQ